MLRLLSLTNPPGPFGPVRLFAMILPLAFVLAVLVGIDSVTDSLSGIGQVIARLEAAK